MPQVEELLGGYDYRQMIEIFGSFTINGTSTPDALRDGKTVSFTVARTSAGLFTVTLTGTHALPERLVFEGAFLSQKSLTPVLAIECNVVADTWSSVTRTFQILCQKVGDTGASAYFDPAPADPDDNSRVNFLLKGSICSAGVDAA